MKRILTIDGGGIKGVFPSAFLATVEEAVGANVSDFFDLIVGTSTGGIIALGLGLGFTAGRILSFYTDSGPAIFSGNRVVRLLRQFGVSKYSQVPLRNALTNYFGTRTLGESTKRLVIPSLNLETGKVHVFKTAHQPRFEVDYKERVVDVALATAAAPTFFPTHQLAGTPLVDGGMWANNPVGVAVVEAIGVLGWAPDSLRVLSLGCTHEPFNINLGRSLSLGSLYWAGKISEVFMAGQASASLGTAELLAGRENIYRVDPEVPAKRFSLDRVSGVTALSGLGREYARQELPKLRAVFFQQPADVFEPYHRSTS